MGVCGGGVRAGTEGLEVLHSKEVRVALERWEVLVWGRWWGFGEEGLAELVEGVVGVLLCSGEWVIIIVEVNACGEGGVRGEVGMEEIFEDVGGEDREVGWVANNIRVGIEVGELNIWQGVEEGGTVVSAAEEVFKACGDGFD